jgi:membrane associated rhomboid family serine protease
MRGAVRAIILINVAIYLLQQVIDLDALALWPGNLFRPWQLVTYAFLHQSVMHVGFNMFALFVFGRALENRWGSARFTIFYLTCVIAAAATQLAVQRLSSNFDLTEGASGGVFGVLLAFAMFFPRERILVLPIPIPVPAWLFVTLYAGLELFLGVTGTQAGVAHFAHLGGMLGAAVLLLYDKFSPPTDRTPLQPPRIS